MTPPYMQLYVGDYLGDTRHLTTEQHGAYLLILMTMWRNGGSLPDDDKKLARIACCTASRWGRISGEIREFFDVESGQIYSKRLMLELKKAQEKSNQRSIIGSAGGKAKALKSLESDVAKATYLPPYVRASSEPEPEPYKEREDSPKPPEGAEETLSVSKTFETCWTAYPHVKTRMSKNKSLAAFRKLPETHRSSLLQAIADYRATLKPRDLEFVKAFHLWLRDRLYEAFLKSNNQSDEEWAARLHYFRKDGTWYDSWGPKPGEAGCEMPSKFLKDQPPQADEF